MRKALWCASLAAATLSFGDVLQFVNGDRYTGEVISVNASEVRVTNDVTGALTIPRAKVVSIHFGSSNPAPLAVATPPAPSKQTDAFKVDPAAVEQVQREILGTANPEANQLFREMVQGLTSGSLNLGDIHLKAQETLEEVRKLQAELGDDDTAGLLNSYVGILEGFVKQVGTNAPTPKAPAKKKSPVEAEE